MDNNITIPCPVCEAPVLIKYLRLPSGDVSRVYTEPLFTDEEVFSFHQHQLDDAIQKTLH